MRYEIGQLLRDAYPEYVSGGELSRRFNISRTAIWKYVEELRREGYCVEASSRKGYRMMPSEGRLNSWEITDNLGTQIVGRVAQYVDTIDSTNNYAKKLAAEGCVDGLTVVAGQQTAGRGRLGRSWKSQPDKGIYITVVLRPDMAPAETQIFTLAAAVAVVKAISAATGICPGIKWPNDLVTAGKKVCGILLEMSSEADRVNYIVLGIGINYSQETDEFPEELRSRAISLKMAADAIKSSTTFKQATPQRPFSRLSVIRSVLRELDTVYRLILAGGQEKILQMWREYSVTIGREVRFILRDTEYTGIAVEITGDGKLSVECSDGIRRDLYSGEVSVRGIYDYV